MLLLLFFLPMQNEPLIIAIVEDVIFICKKYEKT